MKMKNTPESAEITIIEQNNLSAMIENRKPECYIPILVLLKQVSCK